MKAVTIALTIFFAWVSGVGAGNASKFDYSSSIGALVLLMVSIACGVIACHQ